MTKQLTHWHQYSQARSKNFTKKYVSAVAYQWNVDIKKAYVIEQKKQ